ncbi:MAG: hypothetical protein ACLSVD_13015 [Eggerthellaceae bacterium]
MVVKNKADGTEEAVEPQADGSYVLMTSGEQQSRHQADDEAGSRRGRGRRRRKHSCERGRERAGRRIRAIRELGIRSERQCSHAVRCEQSF